ncbi:MAG: hypothetical protein M1472_00020 [Planctomycetes bacterium]|nr:hypothetical protein [Planctomycetota bacterium]
MNHALGSRSTDVFMLLAALALATAAGFCRAGETQYLAQDTWTLGNNVETWNQGFVENKSWVRNDSTSAQISLLDFSGRLRLADTGRYSPTVAYVSTYNECGY